MWKRILNSRIYIFCFVFFLAVPQIIAFGVQFKKGFFPFKSEPTRVPFSWDMFSVPVERCELRWTPSIKLGIHTLSSLREAELPLEWDVTYDRVFQYIDLGKWLCGFGMDPSTSAQLHHYALNCYVLNGTKIHEEFDCH